MKLSNLFESWEDDLGIEDPFKNYNLILRGKIYDLISNVKEGTFEKLFANLKRMVDNQDWDNYKENERQMRASPETSFAMGEDTVYVTTDDLLEAKGFAKFAEELRPLRLKVYIYAKLHGNKVEYSIEYDLCQKTQSGFHKSYDSLKFDNKRTTLNNFYEHAKKLLYMILQRCVEVKKGNLEGEPYKTLLDFGGQSDEDEDEGEFGYGGDYWKSDG